MGTQGDDPIVRNTVGKMLNRVTGMQSPDLAHRSMSDTQTNRLRTGQTHERVVNELTQRGYSRRAAEQAVKNTAETRML